MVIGFRESEKKEKAYKTWRRGTTYDLYDARRTLGVAQHGGLIERDLSVSFARRNTKWWSAATRQGMAAYDALSIFRSLLRRYDPHSALSQKGLSLAFSSRKSHATGLRLTPNFPGSAVSQQKKTVS